MDIGITSTLTETDITVLKSKLASDGMNEKEFKKVLTTIEEETNKLEESYKSEESIFPEHDFKKLAFENVLNEFENSQNNTEAQIDSEKSPLTETSSSNSVTAVPLSSTPMDSTTTTKVKSPTVESTLLTSSIPSVEHLNDKTQYDSIIQTMAQKYDVPFNLVKLVINAESSFNPKAVSKSGAMGLMQLMPSTAKWLGVENAYNPKENIEGGTKYLNYLLKRFDGDVTLAVAGYNAGPGNVDKYKGIPPFNETQNYVKKILG